ncbi:hypothetical protein PHLCEN_2v13441 [Hermanssonia centrifuga]|uniref:non-specific serine/threonine protein kinase n=1 Tax=Hermanssonia centrifuga TaxID=98765 RepID=A0A2R6NEK1_9APHY|nr:hypothetical protein PHLCEN_2v13441 [Hermanssonia centrifuga]
MNVLFSMMSQRRFRPSQLDHVEDLEEYRPGGLHPVEIGDTFASGSYRVLHKLGFGGTSSIWLTCDQQLSTGRLTVMRAEQSAKARDRIVERTIPQKLHDILRANDPIALRNVKIMEDDFMHQGLNGARLCHVSRFAGPSVHCAGRVSGSKRFCSNK